MEGRAKLVLFSFFCSLSLSLSSSFQHQTLVVNSLPKPSSLLPFHQTQEFSEPETSTTLSVQLHHIDSLSVNSTAEELFSLRLKRDALRVKALNNIAAAALPNATRSARGRDFSSSVVSGLAQGSGEYFTRLGVGTPPKYMYMVLDTGSDVVWIQCMPCKKCYTQTDPVFNPTRSHSFVSIPCRSPVCLKLDQPGCTARGNKCAYQVSYGDGSFTIGEFAAETMTFRGTRVPNVALGCGHDNEGLFVGAAGLLGLGRGRLSFPSQTGRRFGRKFSYCLVDRSASSKPSAVVFGESSVSRNAAFTPLLTNPKLDTFYYVELVGMSVGGTRVPGITGELFKIDGAGNGGVIVDSGTSVTRLAQTAYTALRNAFRAGASALKSADGFSLFDTCYDLSGKTTVRVPTVVMHFSGADVSLPANNYMIPVDTSGRFCFAFAGTMSGLSIIGNIQQQGFRVVFDMAGRRVGFAPGACA
ncbi:Aspartyl protease protein 2 [Ancistrocladus abbreviatus]